MTRLENAELRKLFSDIYYVIVSSQAARDLMWPPENIYLAPSFDKFFLDRILREGFPGNSANIDHVFRLVEVDARDSGSSTSDWKTIIMFLGNFYRISYTYSSDDGYSYENLIHDKTGDVFYYVKADRVTQKVVIKTEYI